METCIYCEKVELCNCFIANERVSLKIYGEDERTFSALLIACPFTSPLPSFVRASLLFSCYLLGALITQAPYSVSTEASYAD